MFVCSPTKNAWKCQSSFNEHFCSQIASNYYFLLKELGLLGSTADSKSGEGGLKMGIMNEKQLVSSGKQGGNPRLQGAVRRTQESCTAAHVQV